MNKFQITSILIKSCIYYLSTIAVTCSTEVPTTRVSLSGLGGPDYSSGCGVPPVGSSWSSGGTYIAFFCCRWTPCLYRRQMKSWVDHKDWGNRLRRGFQPDVKTTTSVFFNHLKDLRGRWKLNTPNVFM